jgi:hypothetical protein
LAKGNAMRDFQILVLGPLEAAASANAIAVHVRARGISVWSECLEEGAPDAAALAWADAVVVVDPSPDAALARRPMPWSRHPRILVASAWLPSDGFDHVLPTDCSPLVIAAVVERLVHRGALSLTRMRGSAALLEG